MTLPTPQVSGAQADLSLSTLLAAVAGACTAAALYAEDPIAEARAVRRLRPARAVLIVALLITGGALFSWGPHGVEVSDARSYLFFAAGSLVIGRLGGLPAAAVAFAAYTGACLFGGVPVEGRPRAWAVPMQHVEGLAPLAVTAVAAAAVAVLVTWHPVMPAGYRRLRLRLAVPR